MRVWIRSKSAQLSLYARTQIRTSLSIAIRPMPVILEESRKLTLTPSETKQAPTTNYADQTYPISREREAGRTVAGRLEQV